MEGGKEGRKSQHKIEWWTSTYRVTRHALAAQVLQGESLGSPARGIDAPDFAVLGLVEEAEDV